MGDVEQSAFLHLKHCTIQSLSIFFLLCSEMRQLRLGGCHSLVVNHNCRTVLYFSYVVSNPNMLALLQCPDLDKYCMPTSLPHSLYSNNRWKIMRTWTLKQLHLPRRSCVNSLQVVTYKMYVTACESLGFEFHHLGCLNSASRSHL